MSATFIDHVWANNLTSCSNNEVFYNYISDHFMVAINRKVVNISSPKISIKYRDSSDDNVSNSKN